MTKGIVTCNLYKRKGSPSVNAPKLGYFTSGDEIVIEDVVLGETENDYYEGVATWYRLPGDVYVWSGGVSMDTELPVFKKKLELDSSPSNDALKEYDPSDYWWIKDFGIDKLWEQGLTGKGIKIAILDSGLALPHPDFITDEWVLKDFSGPNNPRKDVFGHGTHMTGIIASTNNGFGVKGVAYGARIYFGKVFHDIRGFELELLENSFEWALNQSVDIISISLGESETSTRMSQLITQARADNVLVVCAAGNSKSGNNNNVLFPARYNETLSIGGCTSGYKPLATSICPPKTELFAPGHKIKSTYLDKGYFEDSGSSQAAAFVSGSAALVLEKLRVANPEFKAFDLKNWLLENAIGLNGVQFINFKSIIP